MALFDQILSLEQIYPFFNKHSLTIDDLAIWCDQLGILLIEDRTIKTPMAFAYKDERGVVINPWHNPIFNILAIGHEIGHHVLGHIDNGTHFLTCGALFSRSGIEKDASIIGFLCWIPTWTLIAIENQYELDTQEEVCRIYCNCDTDYQWLRKIIMARFRIYDAFKRINIWRGRYGLHR